jgi:hypothetical protein
MFFAGLLIDFYQDSFIGIMVDIRFWRSVGAGRVGEISALVERILYGLLCYRR